MPLEQRPEANREFAGISKFFVVAYLDTRNGRAPFAEARGILRNQTYVLVLSPEGKELGRLEEPKSLKAITAFLRHHIAL